MPGPNPPTAMHKVRLRLAAGGWVQLCRSNAERLLREPQFEVQCMKFMREWAPMSAAYEYTSRMKFRARLKEEP